MNKPQSNLEYKKGYGQNYANLRKKEYNLCKDYSVRDLSAEIHIAPSTISQIENEKREPTVEQVMIYKNFFGVSLDYLAGETKVTRLSLQDICEYIGLSESAVSALVQLKEMNDSKAYGDLLSLILSNPNLQYVLGLAETCIAGNDEKKSRADTSFSQITFSETEIALFALNNAIGSIIKQITSVFLSDYNTSEIRTLSKVLDKQKAKVVNEYEKGVITESEKNIKIEELEPAASCSQSKAKSRYCVIF